MDFCAYVNVFNVLNRADFAIPVPLLLNMQSLFTEGINCAESDTQQDLATLQTIVTSRNYHEMRTSESLTHVSDPEVCIHCRAIYYSSHRHTGVML